MRQEKDQDPLNIKKAMKIFDDDLLLYKELLGKFIAEFPLYMNEILDDINNQNDEGVSLKVHRIKGMLLNLGAEKAYKCACILEKKKIGNNFENIKSAYEDLKRELVNIKTFFLKNKKDFN